MDWMNLLKVKQIVTPTTKISQRKEPKEEPDRDCCQEAKDSYKKLHSSYRGPSRTRGSIKEYDIMYSSKRQKEIGKYGGYANKSCEEFREYMERGDTSEDTAYGKILTQWNKCEGRD